MLQWVDPLVHHSPTCKIMSSTQNDSEWSTQQDNINKKEDNITKTKRNILPHSRYHGIGLGQISGCRTDD